jgi:copper chaperone
MKTVNLKIEGMHCGHCVMAVRKELSKVPHVEVQDVQIGNAKIAVDEAKVTGEQLSNAIAEAGYRLISTN